MVKGHLPEEGLYMLRYHWFYAWYREGAYSHLLDDHDKELLKWVCLFNPYDLYSKNPTPPVWSELKPYNEDLVAKYLPLHRITFYINVKAMGRAESKGRIII